MQSEVPVPGKGLCTGTAEYPQEAQLHTPVPVQLSKGIGDGDLQALVGDQGNLRVWQLEIAKVQSKIK